MNQHYDPAELVGYFTEKIRTAALAAELDLEVNIGFGANISPKSGNGVHADVVDGILTVSRKPYKLPDIGAESIDVRLELFMNLRLTDHQKRLAVINGAIVGLQNGTDSTGQYTIQSELDLEAPNGVPVVESGGRLFHCYAWVGSVFAMRTSDGATTGNIITTTLTIPALRLGEEEARGSVTVLERRVGFAAAATSLSDSGKQDCTAASVQSYHYLVAYTVLYRNDAVCRRLLEMAEGFDAPRTGTIILVGESFPSNDGTLKTVTHRCVLTACNLIGDPGEFCALTLQLERAPQDDALNAADVVTQICVGEGALSSVTVLSRQHTRAADVAVVTKCDSSYSAMVVKSQSLLCTVTVLVKADPVGQALLRLTVPPMVSTESTAVPVPIETVKIREVYPTGDAFVCLYRVREASLGATPGGKLTVTLQLMGEM